MTTTAALISLGSESSKWTADAMRRYFDVVDEIDIRKIEIRISGRDDAILYDGKSLKSYDCIYAKGSFRYAELLKSLTSILERKCYMPLASECFTIAHDKLLTHLELQRSNIPMPNTYITATVPAAKTLLRTDAIKYPIMMKFPQGTGGKGVMFAESYESASSILDALQTLRQPFILQEYVETGRTDYRIIVVGSKVIAAMKRTAANGEARANFHSGGSGEKLDIDPLTTKIAIDVARTIKAEICAVDILPSTRGPLVIEANISPGLQLISKATGKDIADIIAKHLFDTTVARKKRIEEHEKTKLMGILDYTSQKRKN